MLTRELLQSYYGWPDTHLSELALAAAEALVRSGLTREAALVWLDQVYTQPERYLGDPVLAPLARARMHRAHWSVSCTEEECGCLVACQN